MTILIYDRAMADPRIKRLDDAICWAWLQLVSACARKNSDTLSLEEIVHTLAEQWQGSVIVNLVRSELIRETSVGIYQLLARGDLWEIKQ